MRKIFEEKTKPLPISKEMVWKENWFVRYADDIIIHCVSENQACFILRELKSRLAVCGLSAHPEKTRIVYCKDYRRNLKGKKSKFDFLGFSFRPVSKPSKRGGMFLGYDCEISQKSYITGKSVTIWYKFVW